MKITIINHPQAEPLTFIGNRLFTKTQLDEIRGVE